MYTKGGLTRAVGRLLFYRLIHSTLPSTNNSKSIIFFSLFCRSRIIHFQFVHTTFISHFHSNPTTPTPKKSTCSSLSSSRLPSPLWPSPALRRVAFRSGSSSTRSVASGVRKRSRPSRQSTFCFPPPPKKPPPLLFFIKKNVRTDMLQPTKQGPGSARRRQGEPPRRQWRVYLPDQGRRGDVCVLG